MSVGFPFKVTTSVSTVVSLTPSAGWFTDAALTQAVTFPVTVSTTTTFWSVASGYYTLSAVYAGRDYGSVVYVGPANWPSVNIVPQAGDPAPVTNATPAKLGVMETGMIPAFSNNHGYPVPSSGSLNANGGVMAIEARVATSDLTEVRMILANRYFTSVEPVESDGPNTVVQRHGISYPHGVLRYVAGTTAWSSVTAYVVGDQITLSGNSYVCLVNNTNSTPAVGGTANWAQVGFYPFHFPAEGANRDVTLQSGQHIISDPVSIDIKAGTKVGVRGLAQPNNGTANTGSYPTGFALQAFGGDYYINSVTGTAVGVDWTLADPTTTATATTSQNSPCGVLVGRPAANTGNRKYLGCIGDSLIAGSGDATLFGNNEPGGWFVRAINRAYPYIRVAHTGDTLSGFTRSGTSQHRRSFVGDPDVYLSELVTNDMTVALATLQASKLAEWAYYKNRGALVVAVLVQPRTTSTDSWATNGNQTGVSGWTPAGTSNRDAYNDWVKTKPAGVDYVLDWLSVVETAPKSGLWRNVGNGDAFVYTTDGTHPNNAAAVAIAAVASPVLSTVMASVT